MKTYGAMNQDWSSVGPGALTNFHTGIDITEFNDIENVWCVEEGVLRYRYPDWTGEDEYRAVISPSMTSEEGWCYAHVQGNDGDPMWLENAPIGESYDYGALIGTMAEGVVPFKHLHFARTGPEATPAYPGIDNPLDYLEPAASTAENFTWLLDSPNMSTFFLRDYPAFDGPDDEDWEHLWPTASSVYPAIINRTELNGAVDLFFNIVAHTKGEIGILRNSTMPQQLEWTLSSYDAGTSSWTELFTRYVVDFDGELGNGGSSPSDWQEYKRLYFKYLGNDIHGGGPVSYVTCLTNCRDATGYDGIHNIDENCWETNVNISGSGPAELPEDALYPDGAYKIDITSYAFDDTELPITTEVVVDNFIPSIEEIKVYSFHLGIQPSNFVEILYTEEWNFESSSRVRTSTAFGYLPSASSGLGIAVRYSEIMDPQNMGYYWFTGESPYGVVYSLEKEKPGRLRPVEGFRRGLGIDPFSIESAYWQSYETSGDCSIDEIGYVGRLALHIGNPAISIIALDLAGNEMDYDPSTIATPRDPVTGQFDYTEVEPGPYDTEAWGESPTWNRSGNIVNGFLDGDLVASVDLDLIGLGWPAVFIGDCRFWCGFWMRWKVNYQYNEFWPMVDFQGNHVELVVVTEFPVNAWGQSKYWSSIPYHYPVLSPDTSTLSGNKCRYNAPLS